MRLCWYVDVVCGLTDEDIFHNAESWDSEGTGAIMKDLKKI